MLQIHACKRPVFWFLWFACLPYQKPYNSENMGSWYSSFGLWQQCSIVVAGALSDTLIACRSFSPGCWRTVKLLTRPSNGWFMRRELPAFMYQRQWLRGDAGNTWICQFYCLLRPYRTTATCSSHIVFIIHSPIIRAYRRTTTCHHTSICCSLPAAFAVSVLPLLPAASPQPPHLRRPLLRAHGSHLRFQPIPCRRPSPGRSAIPYHHLPRYHLPVKGIVLPLPSHLRGALWPDRSPPMNKGATHLLRCCVARRGMVCTLSLPRSTPLTPLLPHRTCTTTHTTPPHLPATPPPYSLILTT